MKCLILSLVLVTLAAPSLAASFGAPDTDNVQDTATVCMQVGAQAELTGLDNIALSPQGVDGAAGTQYTGSDAFQLSSNVPVRVLIESERLSNNASSISTKVLLDGISQFYDTETGVPHDAEHELTVTATLGAISSQLAGHYETTVVLTVIPLQGGDGGCGEVTLTFPGDSNENYAVIAFEDRYPDAGDADYNDFVVRYSVAESYNATGGLETIEMNFTPIARGASFNHELKLDLDGIIKNTRNAYAITDGPFIGDAQVKLTYTNLENGTEIVKYYGVDDDVTIFHNTRSALDGFANVYDGAEFVAPKVETKVEITLASPELNQITEAHEITMDKYRIFLDVLSTNNDIDLAEVNPDDGMVNPDGYPFGIIVPTDWAWMLESRSIDEAYPYFEEYRQYLSGEISTLSPEAAAWYSAVDTEADATVDLEALEIFLAQ